MGLGSHRIFYVSFSVIAVTIALTQATAFYYSQHASSDSPRSGCSVFVCTLINFGNSTSRWYNETNVPVEWDFYNLTVFIAQGNIQAEYYAPLNEHLVTAIDGIGNDSRSSWTLWLYCDKQNAWFFSSTGADAIKVTRGLTLAWAYEISNSHSPPIEGSATTISCA